MIIIEIILLLWLLEMSIIDIRKGSFSGKYLFFALVFFSVAIGILCFLNLKDWKSVVSGGAAGSVFLIASIVTQGAIGLGDGYILTICGIVMGLYQVMVLIIFAFALSLLLEFYYGFVKKRADTQKYHLHHLYVPVMG